MNCKEQRAKSQGHRATNYSIVAAALMLIVAGCGNRVIERSAADYLPYTAGNWWRYNNNSSYEPQTIFVEVEPADTVMQIECYPVTFSGVASYYEIGNTGIREYIKIVHFFAGAEYTVLEGFAKRIVTPLVSGSVFIDSLVDSLNVAGDWIVGRYQIQGLVSEYYDDGLYGNVYKLAFTTRRALVAPDTAFVEDRQFTEYYAAGVGLVRFDNEQGEFRLSEYDLK